MILAGSPGVSGSQLSYKFIDLNSIKPDMITEATKNARAAAERFALDSGALTMSKFFPNLGCCCFQKLLN